MPRAHSATAIGMPQPAFYNRKTAKGEMGEMLLRDFGVGFAGFDAEEFEARRERVLCEEGGTP